MAESQANFPSLQSTGPSSLGSEGPVSFGEDDPEFVHEADRSRFLCPVHKGLLRETRQTPCGHRLCRRCVGIWLNGAASKRCPVGESDCDDITEGNVNPDRSIQRDMKSVPVYCKNRQAGCTVKLQFKDWKKHLDDCPFQLVQCDYSERGCKENILRSKLKEHQDTCPFRPERCKLCQEEVSRNQMKNHDENVCPEKVTGCPFGCNNKTLKRKEVPDHRDVCPAHPVDCKFKQMGCTFVGKREAVEKHEKEDLSLHLALTTDQMEKIQQSSRAVQDQLRTMSAQNQQLEDRIQRVHGRDSGTAEQIHNANSQIRDLKLKVVSIMEKVIIVERKMPELADIPRVENLEQRFTGIQQRVTQLEQTRQREQQQGSSSGGGRGTAGTGSGGGGPVVGANTQVGRYGTVENMADTLSNQLSNHETQLQVHDVRMAEMDLRFQLLETASYNGTLIWKIKEYSRRKRDAVNGRTLSLYSQPFYTSRFGYKMCTRVYLNGDGMGKTTHMSLFFVVMRGEYDPLLTWPFRQKVTLTLLDQTPEKRHLSDHFQPDPNSSSFQKPTTEMNVASGCPMFVSHTVLENPANNYLKDDTIFIRVIVDTSQNPAAY